MLPPEFSATLILLKPRKLAKCILRRLEELPREDGATEALTRMVLGSKLLILSKGEND